MKLITSFTSDAAQSLTIALDDGSLVNFSIYYVANQQGWFFNLTYGSFTLNGARLVVSPNMLRAFRNVISFGLACVSLDGYEPLYITDFTSGRILIYSLNSSDVSSAETLITTTLPALAGTFRN